MNEFCLLGHKIRTNPLCDILDCTSCNARKEAFCLASVTYMTRDINDTFVTNHPDDRKTLLCW